MEKDFRLFVKNLPLNISEDKVRDLFSQHVTVQKIDLKERKDVDNKIHKFAFVNVLTTDKQLYNCFGALNAERVDGFEISVDIAKESFMERLKREREENQSKKESAGLPKIPISSVNINRDSRAKHKTFSDLDFSPNLILKENKETTTTKINDLEEPMQKHFEESINQDSDKPFKPLQRKHVNESDSNEIKPFEKNKNLKNRDNVKLNNNKKNNDFQNNQKPAVSESERRRQQSVKEKKSHFKAQEIAIRNALRSVDSTKNKIIFDDDGEAKVIPARQTIPKQDNKKMKNALFDDDDDDNNEDGDDEKIEWDEEELEAKSKKNQKLMKLQAKIGYDDRFVLDERFLDDENEDKNQPMNSEKQPNDSENSNIRDEKKRQLKIINNVLGQNVRPTTEYENATKKEFNEMIRYDPTVSDHKEFEINIEKKSKKEKSLKRKSEVIEKVEEPMPKVTKEIFYEVGTLAFGNESREFSLLKSLGDGKLNDNNENRQGNETTGGFKFNFNSNVPNDNEYKKSNKDRSSEHNLKNKNRFKYNVSDDEGYDEEITEKDYSAKSHESDFSLALKKKDIVFFVNDDPRLKEAVQFFKTPNMCEEGDFKNKRRELKEIVRSKIRNNLKKKVPWNKKKIRKESKQK